MKIYVPVDYHEAFKKAVEVSLLIEQGKPYAAFSMIGFSPSAKSYSDEWSESLDKRGVFLRRIEEKLSSFQYSPILSQLEIYSQTYDIICQLEDIRELVINDREAWSLQESLELFCRLSMGQISDAVGVYAFRQQERSIKIEDREWFMEMYHESVTISGHSFGIGSKMISDDARNSWMARKVIQRHLALKHCPGGGSSNRFDGPTRIGSCSKLDVLIAEEN